MFDRCLDDPCGREEPLVPYSDIAGEELIDGIPFR